MELRYYINTTQITEPIGFDDFKTILKRTEQHGVSAESSVGSLEFDGVGYGMIKTAYDTDIDSELIFKCEIKCNDLSDWAEDYKGIIDLSTFEENQDNYCSCKVKIGEIGVKTTFNNRVDTKVDVGSLLSLDGDVITTDTNINKNIVIPNKDILYQNKAFCDTYIETTGDSENFVFVFPCLNVNSITEHGTLTPDNDNVFTLSTTKYQFANSNSIATIKLIYNLKCSVDRLSNEIGTATIKLIIYKLVGATKTAIYTSSPTTIEYGNTELLNFNSSINVTTCDQIAVTFLIEKSDSTSESFLFATDPKSFINFTYLSTVADSTSQLSLVGATFNRLSKIYCNTDVKSDYYSLITTYIETPITNIATFNPLQQSLELQDAITFSIGSKCISIGAATFTDLIVVNIVGITVDFNQDISAYYEYGVEVVFYDVDKIIGDGALKAITSGMKLRNSYLTDNSYPKLETSFKDLFLGLEAIDNIGWGFSNESGVAYLRVENWKWFYNNNVLMTIDNPSKKRRSMRDNVFTRLKTGYSKYGGQDDINSIDTFHTDREFTTKIKAIDKLNTQISKLIADPYAIEFTRRKALDKTTKDWKYDQDLFVLCLKRNMTTDVLSVEQGITGSDDTIISPETMTNFRISPERNALRFADSMFELNSPITELSFTAGNGNVTAKGEPTVVSGYLYLNDSANGDVLIENENVAKVNPYLKPEIIEFEYPLTRSEYETIKADPYGIITVDGEDCYIDEIIRTPMTSLTIFKLIPKI